MLLIITKSTIESNTWWSLRKHAEYGFKSLAWVGTRRVNMLSCSVARGISDGALIHIIGHVDLKLCSSQ